MPAEFFSPQLFGWVMLALAPLVLAVCTAFTKVSVVLTALRTGLGAEKLLPFGVVLALSVVVTSVIMGPTALRSWEALAAAGGPDAVLGGSFADWLGVLEPLRRFLLDHSDPGELDYFAILQDLPVEHPLVLIPSFLVTELGEALQMAVLILLPFLLVDLLVAQVLALMGMPHAPGSLISLPAKVLLFLGAGGWQLIIGSLVEGYL